MCGVWGKGLFTPSVLPTRTDGLAAGEVTNKEPKPHLQGSVHAHPDLWTWPQNFAAMVSANRESSDSHGVPLEPIGITGLA